MSEEIRNEYLGLLKRIKPYFKNEYILIPFNSYPRVFIRKDSVVWVQSLCLNESHSFPNEQFEEYKLYLKNIYNI